MLPFPESEVTSTLMLTNIAAGTKAGTIETAGIKHLDIFIFNDDGEGRLDSYSSTGVPDTEFIRVESTTGDKLVVMIANMEGRNISANDIMSYENLENLTWYLKDEDPSFPIMSGECHINAGESGYTPIQLTPVMSNVCLDFLDVDFSGKGYRSRTLENASIYLTNISVSAEILRSDGFKATDLANCGSLDESWLESMKKPSMLYSRVMPGQWRPVNLYCYPNDGADGSLGRPVTRMVIQGDIDGKTYYYPIEVNQEGFGYVSGPHGLSRNVKYSYGIRITRKGSTDPDTLVSPEEIVTQGWIRLNPGQLITGKTGESIHVWCDMFPEDAELDISLEDLEYDVERGIYDYEIDPDGHGVTLFLKNGGTGMFTIDAGPPINDGFLVFVVVNP